MTGYRYLSVILTLTLLLASPAGPVRASTLPNAEPASPETTLPETLQGIPEATDGWWAAVQEDIRQSEYHITWQEHIYLADLPATSALLGAGAYQAPNRAHNLRTYFAPAGVRLIPRVFEGETPPWEWGLTLTGFGYTGDVQLVTAATLQVDENRIEYQRGDPSAGSGQALTEWYVNDERGLEQGFTLPTAPQSTIRNPQSEIILDLALSGNLTAAFVDGGQTIEFSTAPSPGSGQNGGVSVLSYGELVVYDAAARRLPARLSLYPGGEGRVEGGIRITFDAAGALYPITVDPLTTSPNWTVEGDDPNANLGWSVRTAGDVNGDGYSDVIVGAPLYDGGDDNEGRAYVYHGSPTGLATSHNWTAESDLTDAQFGYSVGTAGDVDGDGYSDVIVGAPYYYDSTHTDEGWVYVYHGSETGLSSTADWTAESDQAGANFGWSVGTAGDVNGDGYSDVIVGAPYYESGEPAVIVGRAYVYHGSDTVLSDTADWTDESDLAGAQFGYSVGTAGDVDGDGYSDVIVGAPYYGSGESEEGQAYVYHGSETVLSSTADWTAESDQADANFGWSVGTAGDVNGDGYSDVIVGAPYYTSTETDEGRAYVYHGSETVLSSTADWTVESDLTGAQFGYSVGTVGDVNGDGYSDVIVGAPYYDSDETDGGFANVYNGSAAGLSSTADWTVESDLAGAQFGYSVGTAGDVNGDGYSDVIVGAPLYDGGQEDEGRAYVYHGSASGLSDAAAWTAESDQGGAEFGWSVGTAGDVNGDGYSDVIVGAPRYDDGIEMEGGRAYVYHGSATGLSTTADWTVESDLADTRFGWSVGTAGDVNGDGYSDVIVGAPYFTNGETREGWAYVYHGSAAGLSSTADWSAESDQTNARFGWSVGTAGDVNGDGFSDVIVGAYWYDHPDFNEGRAYVYHGSSVGLSSAADWTAESDQAGANFGESVGTAGDVNGDGYSDVIVGAPAVGRAYVYHGSAAGLSSIADPWTAESDQAGVNFGQSVGTAGDVNGDGYSDVIVGVPYYENGESAEGRAYVYHGSETGLSTEDTWTAESDLALSYFGESVGTAGDVNGDGYSDVIVGAPNYNNGETEVGRAYVYHGSATGLSTTDPWTTESDQGGSNFGYSVGTAGDVNGDGYSDVIVGAYWYDNEQTAEGRAFVYYGNGGDGLHLLPRQVRSDGSAPIAHLGMSDSYTAFQLRLTGRMPLGREDVRLQWQVAPLGTLITATSVISGTSGWTDVLTTSVEISQTINVAQGIPYHWRVRLLYRPGNALGQPAGRWVHIPWAGWNETDLRIKVNIPPVAKAGPDQAVDKDALVTLDGSESSDADGDLPLTYNWTQTSGTAMTFTPAYSVTTFTAPSDPEVLKFTLVVTDSLGLADPTPDEVVVTVGNQPPVADAGSDQEVDTNAPVTLNGSDSSDPDVNLPLTYNWTQTGGSTVDFTPALSVTTFTALSDPEVLTFTLDVTDSLGLPDPTPDEVVVTVVNQPPEAAAGSPQEVDTNALVTLDGRGSSDPDGDLPLAYNWTQTGGTAMTFTPGLSVITFTAPSDPAVLTFTLVVTDSWGLPDPTPDEVVVTVANQPPVAAAGSDQEVDINAPVTLDGSESSDPDGDLPLAYNWTQTGGPAVTLSDQSVVTPTFTAPPDPAVLTFTLVVTDSLGLPDPTPDEVVVTVGNQPPEADAGSDQAVDTNALVTLDGSGSSDPDGNLPLVFNWTQTGGPVVTFTPALSVTTFTAPPDPAVLTFTLVVTDSLGLPDPTPDEVVVTITNQSPVAYAGPDQAVDTNALVTLDGSGSSDPDGDLPLVYNWTQTGGLAVIFTPGLSVTTFTAPSDPAVLTFTLVVTDSLGLPDPTPDEVVVSIANQPPEADAGLDQAVDTNAMVTLDGSGSSDPDGDLPLTYHWTQTGGPTVTLSDLDVVKPTFTAPSAPAVLTFALVVTDNLGLPDPTPDGVVVSIANLPPEADAGSDQAVDTNALVTLDGSGSSDPDGDLPLAYNWTQTGGPAVTLSDPDVVMPTFTAPSAPAVLTFALVVTDNLGLPDPTPDEVVVTVDVERYRIYLPLVDTGGTVTPPSGAPVIERFTVEPAVIQLNTCAKVDWAVAGEVTNIKILGYIGGNETVLMANADRTGSFESCPTVIGEVLYKIVATGPGGTVEQQTSIQVQ